MGVRRGIAAGVVGLALLVGATGCGGGEEADAGVEADVGAYSASDLPDGYPAVLAPPEGTNLYRVRGGGTGGGYDVRGFVGDTGLEEVFEDLEERLTEAGYTVDGELRASDMDPSAHITAQGGGFRAELDLSATTIEGEVELVYVVEPA